MVKRIVFGIALIAVLAGVVVWSYERGLATSNAMEATRLMVIMQRQNDCIENSDMSCTAEVNSSGDYWPAATFRPFSSE